MWCFLFRIMVFTHNERVEIVTLHETEFAARQLAERFNVCPNTICDPLYKYQQVGSVDDRGRPGKPNKLTQRQERQLLGMSAQSPMRSSSGKKELV